MRFERSDAESAQKRERVHQVLENVVECATRKSPFQRVIATCYSRPLQPGGAAPMAEVLDFAYHGLDEASCRRLHRLLGNGFRVSGERYRVASRVGRCFFFPRGENLAPFSPVIPSSRSYLGHGCWNPKDVFLVPFWIGERILGHISLDDPRDGLRPRESTRLLLEEFASVAALALRDACSLQELSESHRFFRFFADCAMTGLLVVQDDRIRYANDEMVSMLGYEKPHLEALSPWWNFVHPDDRPVVWDLASISEISSRTLRAIRKDGRVIWLAMRAHNMLYAGSDAVAFQFYEITERIRTEELLKEKALRDPLTGFHNRGYFEDAIQTELQRSKRYRRSFTLMMADLANFKQVNDKLGHQEGDRLLAGIASVIQQALRESDWGVRYGGDEFLLILPETGTPLDTLVRRLDDSVTAWCRENVVGVEVGIDFGWATWASDNPEPIDQLVRKADAMLYRHKRARQSGNGAVGLDDPS